VRDIRLLGDARLRAVRFSFGGQNIEIEAELAALHEGVIPAQHVARAAGLPHRWDAAQAAFRPALDAWGQGGDGIFVAGDAAGIGGAMAALHEGRIAAAAMLHALGRLDAPAREALAAPERRALERHMAIRPFLDRRYPPAPEVLVPPDEVVVCRCEEVTAGEIRAAIRQGARGPNQAKAFTRAGMGPCQGRICGTAAACVMADALGATPDAIGHATVRPPLKPITLGELAEAG
jgi:bacterioferritin-associated ferredoxin